MDQDHQAAHRHRHAGPSPLCTSCGDRPLEDPVTLCAACVVADGVGGYCRGCGVRLRFSVPQARGLFHAMGKDLSFARPGVVIVFLERCPLCGESTAPLTYPQRILVAELPHDTSVSH